MIRYEGTICLDFHMMYHICMAWLYEIDLNRHNRQYEFNGERKEQYIRFDTNYAIITNIVKASLRIMSMNIYLTFVEIIALSAILA